jgi:hypothetical protein
LLFDPDRNFADYEAVHLAENLGLAAGEYETRQSSANRAEFVLKQSLAEFAADRAAPPTLTIIKHFGFSPAPQGCEVSCDLALSVSAPLARSPIVGIESVINFLAPAASDRFFETPDGPQNLRFCGSLPSPILRLEDGWQAIRATLHAPGSEEFWIAPIETVSESETGFERVYQGSQILSLWRPDLTHRASTSARLIWRLELM